MNNNENDKSLSTINENDVFSKIKNFFKRIFGTEKQDTSIMQENIEVKKEKNSFEESIRVVENEETKLLKLQKLYRSGKIKEKDLTQEQVVSLCELYDKQIEQLRKSNELRKQKLLLYRNKLRTNNQN